MSLEADWNGKLVRIQWDRICRDPQCVTVNGEPVNVSRAKLEWPGNRENGSSGVPVLTVVQVILPERGASGVPSQVEVAGYLVPVDLWEEYWRSLRPEQRYPGPETPDALDSVADTLERKAAEFRALAVTRRQAEAPR